MQLRRWIGSSPPLLKRYLIHARQRLDTQLGWILQLPASPLRCEAGLCPAVRALFNLGAVPPVRPLALNLWGPSPNGGHSPLIKIRLPAGQSPASHRAAKPAAPLQKPGAC